MYMYMYIAEKQYKDDTRIFNKGSIRVTRSTSVSSKICVRRVQLPVMVSLVFHDATLNDCIRVSIEGPDLEEFDFDSCVDQTWGNM